jgi:hypothetical protein
MLPLLLRSSQPAAATLLLLHLTTCMPWPS